MLRNVGSLSCYAIYVFAIVRRRKGNEAAMIGWWRVFFFLLCYLCFWDWWEEGGEGGDSFRCATYVLPIGVRRERKEGPMKGWGRNT